MSSTTSTKDTYQSFKQQWRSIVAKYQEPSVARSAWQIINSFVPYFVCWALMYLSLSVSYWLTLALALPTAGFLVRIFIIQHDCGHGSFFKNAKTNDIWGAISALLCATPYYYWKHDHALHHASNGNLDRRGHGDIWTMTVEEYLTSPWYKKLGYRIYRNPAVMFGVGSFFLFIIEYRIPPRKGTTRDRISVLRTDLALLGVVAFMHFTIGIPAFVMIQAPIFFFAAAAGTWLFYVQHQFEGVYWARDEEWDIVDGSMKGSSYYRLPKVLQWFTGNIGFPHIHHLSSKIPNYFLERCHKENEALQQVHQLTIWSSLKCLRFRVLNEQTGELLTFSQLRALRKSAQA